MTSLNMYVGGYDVMVGGVEKFVCEKHAKPADREAGAKTRKARGLCADCFFEDQQNARIGKQVNVNTSG